MLWWPHTNPSKIGSVPNVMNQAIFRRICMESLEHNCGNISPTICTNMLILGKDTFLVMISLMISTNLISSQILIFVTSHFTTLFLPGYQCLVGANLRLISVLSRGSRRLSSVRSTPQKSLDKRRLYQASRLLVLFKTPFWNEFSNSRTRPDRKSTRLNSSHANISYAVFCLKKKTTYKHAASYYVTIL